MAASAGAVAAHKHRKRRKSESAAKAKKDKANQSIGEKKLDASSLLKTFQTMTKELNLDSAEPIGIEAQAKFSVPCLRKPVDSPESSDEQPRPPRCSPSEATRNAYLGWAEDCKALALHPVFDAVIIVCILLVGVATSIEVHLTLNPEDATSALTMFLDVYGALSMTIFTLEAGIKLVACGETPSAYFTDPEDGTFNTFDFMIVCVSLATIGSEGNMIAVMRLLRLIKLMNRLPALREILLGLIAGVKAVSSIMVLMLLVMFLFSILGNLLFGANDPANFENVERGMLSLFVFATLASWGNVAQVNYFGCHLYHGGMYEAYIEVEEVLKNHPNHTLTHEEQYIDTMFGTFHKHLCLDPVPQPMATLAFFFLYTVITAMVVLSLFISVITTAMFEVMESNRKEKKRYDELTQAPPEERRARVLELIHAPGSPVLAHLNAFFGIQVAQGELNGGVKFSQFPLLGHVQRICFWLAHSMIFQATVMVAIFGVAITEVCDTNDYVGPEDLELVQLWFLGFFTVEAAVKVNAEGVAPLCYFRNSWNQFDFSIVMLSYLEIIPLGLSSGGGIAFLRLLRLLRVVRLFNAFPRLRLVTRSLLMALTRVSWVLLMILMMNFMFSLVAMLMFGINDPQHFGTFSQTAMTIWMIETTDDWDHIMYTNMFGCQNYGYYDTHGFSTTARHCVESYALGWYAAGFIVFVVLLGGFVMPTVLVGVISVSFSEATEKIMIEMMNQRRVERVVASSRTWKTSTGKAIVSDRQIIELRGVFDNINYADDADALEATLDIDELVPFLAYMCEKYLTPLSEKELTQMFGVVDTSGDGAVSWAEFLWFVLFLKKQYDGDGDDGLVEEAAMAAAVDMLKNELNAGSDETFTGLAVEEHKKLQDSLATLGIQAGDVIGSFKETGNVCHQAEFIDALKQLAQFASPTYMSPHHNGHQDHRQKAESLDNVGESVAKALRYEQQQDCKGNLVPVEERIPERVPVPIQLYICSDGQPE